MPGPVSDSFDPEFGTGDNADHVADAVRDVVARLTCLLGDRRRYIVDVVLGEPGPTMAVRLSEREMRVIRFAMERALESL